MAQKQDDFMQYDTVWHTLWQQRCSAYGEVKLGVGPVIEHGFYYDIDLGDETISEEDFPRIEKEMQISSRKQALSALKWPLMMQLSGLVTQNNHIKLSY